MPFEILCSKCSKQSLKEYLCNSYTNYRKTKKEYKIIGEIKMTNPMTVKKTIYIAGKVTGEERQSCIAKFNHAENYLKSKGYLIVNPMKIVKEDSDWNTAMDICLSALKECDSIFLIPDWAKSKGARKEVKLAISLNLEIVNGF
jgi:hypothetical protein